MAGSVAHQQIGHHSDKIRNLHRTRLLLLLLIVIVTLVLTIQFISLHVPSFA